MADQITVQKERSVLPNEGQVAGVCVDVIDMGEKVEQYQQQPPIIVKKAVLVWQIAEQNPETGRPFELSREFTVSFGKKANLRKFLSDWRGKPYTDEQAAEGVPLHKLEKQHAQLTVTHKTSAAGNTYAFVSNISPLHPAIPKAEAKGYKRADYWIERKAEYAADVAKLRGAEEPTDEEYFAGAGAEEDDEMPF